MATWRWPRNLFSFAQGRRNTRRAIKFDRERLAVKRPLSVGKLSAISRELIEGFQAKRLKGASDRTVKADGRRCPAVAFLRLDADA